MRRYIPLLHGIPEAWDVDRRPAKSDGSSYYENQDRLLGVQADAAERLLATGAPYLSDSVAEFATQSRKFNDPAYMEAQVGRARADAAAAAGRNTAATTRALARYGINPNSGRFAAVMRDNEIANAGLEAGMAQRARDTVERMQLAGAKDFYSALVGQQSDATSQVANAAAGYGSTGANMDRSNNEAMAGWGSVAGWGLDWLTKKDGGVVRRALGGPSNRGLFQTGSGAAPVAPPPESAGLDVRMLTKGAKALVPKIAPAIAEVSPTAAGLALQGAGQGVATVGAEQLGLMAPEIASFGTSAIADAAGTAAAGTAAAGAGGVTAAIGAAVPWVAGALAIGEMFDMFADGGKVQTLVRNAAKKHRLPEALLTNVVLAESNGNPRARSPKGATGLMQLMPATARRYGVTDAEDPAQNINGGAAYLADLMAQFKDPVLATAAYNAGPRAVRKWGGVPPFPETRAFVQKLFGEEARAKFAPARGHRPASAPAEDMPQVPKSTAPKQTEHLIAKGDTLSELAVKYGTTVKDLMAANPQIKNPDRIYVGDTLKLACGGKVKKG